MDARYSASSQILTLRDGHGAVEAMSKKLVLDGVEGWRGSDEAATDA
jgi:hypothetical protein